MNDLAKQHLDAILKDAMNNPASVWKRLPSRGGAKIAKMATSSEPTVVAGVLVGADALAHLQAQDGPLVTTPFGDAMFDNVLKALMPLAMRMPTTKARIGGVSSGCISPPQGAPPSGT
jgi:hypothetical protein